jgi:hypothetical protein
MINDATRHVAALGPSCALVLSATGGLSHRRGRRHGIGAATGALIGDLTGGKLRMQLTDALTVQVPREDTGARSRR